MALLPPLGNAQARVQPSAQNPMLIALNSRTSELEGWPIRRGGGNDPEPLSAPLHVAGGGGMAGIGDVVVIGDPIPAHVMLYDTKTQITRVLDDPFGLPLGVAVGKDATVYAINLAKNGAPVTMFKPPAHRAVELNCAKMQNAVAIAVDNEGDIFIQGYAKGGNVAEIPNGPSGPDPQACAILPLKGNAGYVGGIAIDPKTDDLLTLDDPSLCAGGTEGRLTTYPKPYNKNTGRSRIIGMNCTGGLTLNADSTIVFTSDTDVSTSFSFILQRSYPDGGDMGIYHAVNFTGVTTIPNTLPN